MKIERIRIQGYRSLHDVTIEPRPFTVLIGPNNAGKSNIVDALDFLSQAYGAPQGLIHGVVAKGGVGAFIHQWRQRANQIAFDVSVSFSFAELRQFVDVFASNGTSPSPDISIHLNHRFAIAPVDSLDVTEFTLDSERLDIDIVRNGKRTWLRRIDTGQRTADINQELVETFDERTRHLLGGLLGNGMDRGELLRRASAQKHLVVTYFALDYVVAYFLSVLSRVRVFQILPLASKLPGNPTPGTDIDRVGQSLPSLVARMKTDPYRELWGRVLDRMTSIVPTLSDVLIEPQGRQLMLAFRESGRSQPWTAAEMSDGTIQSLALLTTLYDPEKRFTLFEEPENWFHPWGIRVFVDACREVTAPDSNKLVLVTTHSPVLIDLLSPEEVWLVWRRSGRTSVRPLAEHSPDAASAWADGEIDLFGFLNTGVVPEAVPG